MPSPAKSLCLDAPEGKKLEFLRLKVRRVSKRLEQHLGVPRRPAKRPPAIDMLVATILSQNTNDKNSHRAYNQLRERYPDWRDVAEAPLRSIRSAIKVGGMAYQRAPRIKGTLLEIKRRYGSYDLVCLQKRANHVVIEELTSFKGVGVKTASCVLLFAMGRDVFPVDTHVHRICARLGFTPGSKTPEETFRRMVSLVSRGKGHSLHTNLIRFGRSTCRATRPACDACPLYDECVYSLRGEKVPVRRARSHADHDFMLLDNVCR